MFHENKNKYTWLLCDMVQISVTIYIAKEKITLTQANWSTWNRVRTRLGFVRADRFTHLHSSSIK